MRSFSFRAKNIGRERYLTYIMGEGCELDEDVLDYCEENKLKELIPMIYEEDDDYDYLTYDVTGKMTLEKFVSGVMDREKVFKILRNVAGSLVGIKERAIHLSYILLHKGFVYINPDTLELQFICLPVESEASLSAEFKGFVRQLLANMKYDVEEDLSYVGQLLTYINGNSFNLRGLIGLAEALMEDAGIEFEAEEGIATDDGAEIVNVVEDEPEEETENTGTVTDFMKDLGDANDVLPEIGDDDEEDELDKFESMEADEPVEAVEEEPVAEVEEEAVAEPEPVAEAEEEAVAEPEPVAEVEEEPVAEPEPVAEAEEEPVAEPEPVAEAEEELVAEPEPVAEAEEELVAEPEPVAEAEEEPVAEPEPVAEAKEEPVAEPEKAEESQQPASKPESMDEMKAKLEKIVNGDAAGDAKELDNIVVTRPVVKKPRVKVNRAALIQNAAIQEQESAADNEAAKETPEAPVAKSSKKSDAKKDTIIENIDDSLNSEASVAETPKEESKPEEIRTIKSSSVLSKGTASVNNTMLGAQGTIKISPYLIRVNTEERIMITKNVFKIGKANRGVDYTVDGNGAISRQHAIIIQKDGVCCIKDNKSTNHTYVNGKKVEEGEEEILTHDCKVKLGDEEFIFKIR